MKKIGIVFGAAAVVVIAGCKDPNYRREGATDTQNKAAVVPATPAKPVQAKPAPIVIETVPDVPKCKCPRGTKHDRPCGCGASDCACIVVARPVAPAVETTTYVVQRGDYLAKISKKFNVTCAAIRKANPKMKKDIVYVGQKLTIPGKHDVETVAAPAPVAKASRTRTSSSAKFTGATKEYVVKNGDTIGAIAYGNGINIRQLKALNNLTSDALKVGQKLKIPAEKPAKAAKAAAEPAKAVAAKPAADNAVKPSVGEAAAAPAPVAAAKSAADNAAKPGVGADAAAPAPAAAEKPAAEGAEKPVGGANAAAPAADAAPAPVKTTTYVVQDGDDMTGVSISFGVSAAAIRQLNNLGDNDQLKPGQIIKLPADAQQ